MKRTIRRTTALLAAIILVGVTIGASPVSASSGTGGNAGSETADDGPLLLDVDEVLITQGLVDLGSGSFLEYDKVPESPATLAWISTDSGSIAPILTGTLYLNKAEGHCARVTVKYVGDDGLIEEQTGAEYCPRDRDLYTRDLVIGGFDSPDVTAVEVSVERTGWRTKDWEMVEKVFVRLGDA